MSYAYRRAGELMRKVVLYFLAETAGAEVVLSHEHCGYVWASYDEALSRLTFPTAKDLLAKAQQFLEAKPPASDAGPPLAPPT